MFATLPNRQEIIKPEFAYLALAACCRSGNIAQMIETAPGLLLRQARNSKSVTLEQMAELTGYSTSFLSRMEKGKRNITMTGLKKMAEALGLSPSDIISDLQSLEADRVPIVGYVGAGSEAHFYADAQHTGEYAKMPINGGDDSVAVEIRGASLGPALDGWLAYYDDVRTPPTHDMIRNLCVVGLEDDRVLVKMLFPGTINGFFNLHSNNNEPVIENVAIRWAALVVDIARR